LLFYAAGYRAKLNLSKPSESSAADVCACRLRKKLGARLAEIAAEPIDDWFIAELENAKNVFSALNGLGIARHG
jgi:hypothetical protein